MLTKKVYNNKLVTALYEDTGNYIEVTNTGNEDITISVNGIDKVIEAGLSGDITTQTTFSAFKIIVPNSSKHHIVVGLV